MFKPISNDVFLISQATLILLDLMASALLIGIIYLTYIGGALNVQYRGRAMRGIRIVGLIAASAITLAVSHSILYAYGLLPTIVWLFISIPCTVFVYWKLVRAINRPEDMRVPYTMMVLGSIAFLAFGTLVMLWVAGEGIQLESGARVNVATIAQIATIAVSAIGFVFTYIMK